MLTPQAHVDALEGSAGPLKKRGGEILSSHFVLAEPVRRIKEGADEEKGKARNTPTIANGMDNIYQVRE